VDRDEALELLRGGKEGVTEWNRRCGVGEAIPSLASVDLDEADLRGANLSGVAPVRGSFSTLQRHFNRTRII
jgi:hypothetical protein